MSNAQAVAAKLRTAAHQLAATIDSLTALTPEERCDLRQLPLMMAGWADELHPICAAPALVEMACWPSGNVVPIRRADR